MTQFCHYNALLHYYTRLRGSLWRYWKSSLNIYLVWMYSKKVECGPDPSQALKHTFHTQYVRWDISHVRAICQLLTMTNNTHSSWTASTKATKFLPTKTQSTLCQRKGMSEETILKQSHWSVTENPGIWFVNTGRYLAFVWLSDDQPVTPLSFNCT